MIPPYPNEVALVNQISAVGAIVNCAVGFGMAPNLSLTRKTASLLMSREMRVVFSEEAG